MILTLQYTLNPQSLWHGIWQGKNLCPVSSSRWTTYAVPGPQGSFELNGGGARLGEIGDRCVVITYEMRNSFNSAKVIFCTEDNTVEEVFNYPLP